MVVLGGREPLTAGVSAVLREAGLEVETPAAKDLTERIAAGGADVVYLARARPGATAEPDLEDAARSFAASAGARRLVVVASALVYDPHPHHPGRVDEAWRPSGRARGGLAAAWRRLEEQAASAVPGRVTVLRAPALATTGLAGLPEAALFGGMAVTLPGRNPVLQLLDPRDLAEAIRLALASREPGLFNVVPRAAVPLGRALGAAGALRVAVPDALQRPARELLAPIGLSRPGRELVSLRYSGTASGERAAAELGFAARRSSLEALCLARGRPVPPGEDPDPWGMDPGFIDRLGRGLFRWLHDRYWRVEVRGLDAVPRTGPAVLVGLHRGVVAWDAMMLVHLLRRELGRIPRFLIHPGLLRAPFVSDLVTRLGGVLACEPNAARILRAGEMLGVFPEGVRGAFSLRRDAHLVGRFGRGDFVRLALRERAPIVPVVSLGPAEVHPVLGRIESRWWQRRAEWPFIPLMLPLPPLPVRWHTRFLEPLDPAREHPPEAAEDAALVRRISEGVRRRMADAYAEMRSRRPSLFRGSAFPEAASP